MVRLIVVFMSAVVAMPASAGNGFVNWETPHVHPLDLTPNRVTLLAVNTADARLEVFDVSSGVPRHVGSIPVGIDPVSVRARSNDEVWVVNHLSDTVSIVSLATRTVVATLATPDEPTDVVFAGDPQRAFISCSQQNLVRVVDLTSPVAPIDIPIAGEDPRAMVVSPDGGTVYVAVFESGNGTTILGGGADGDDTIAFPPNVVSHPSGPYGGVNPPPNDGASFNPPMKPGNPPPPRVGLIVRKNEAGQWMDDNNGDWTDLVSGPDAGLSGRVPGWDLPDHDVAVIDAATLAVSYVDGLMNLCMAVGVDPATGRLLVVGTDAINEVRFEPVVGGIFVRVKLASVDPLAGDGTAIVDLNSHLDYSAHRVPQPLRDLSIGDPRSVIWNPDHARGYVAGMGSNNVIVVDANGARAGRTGPIEVGEGPTGLALDSAANRLFVLNKFHASISTIDTATETEIDRTAFFDPTPPAIKTGRKHLYDTRKTSGLGQASCASCHIDARMDRLAWDLGDPAGDMRGFNQSCNLGIGLLGTCDPWHPMKGPMTSQTLQDIIAHEPHHWRGDRNGLEEFNGAFVGLLGDDVMLTPSEMQEFESFLATIHFPPNPFRNVDNTLPTNLPLSGHFATGRFAAAGTPLPNGNAVNGLNLYSTAQLDMAAGLNIINCVTCHTLPTGMGSNRRLVGGQIQPFPTGPNGEQHLTVVSVDGSTNGSIKVPHLRNLYEKVGFETTQSSNVAGFGFLHDGSVDSIARFVSEPVFSLDNVQQLADMVAFMLAFSGSDLPVGTTNNILNLRGPDGQDSHAAIGLQLTVDAVNHDDPNVVQALDFVINLSDSDRVGLIGKSFNEDRPQGFMHAFSGAFQTDRVGVSVSGDALRAAAAQGRTITFTVVPFGTQTRMGVDRDADGIFDGDEFEGCSDGADAISNPNNVVITGDADGNSLVDVFDYAVFESCVAEGAPQPAAGPLATRDCRCAFDFDRDGGMDLHDFGAFQQVVGS